MSGTHHYFTETGRPLPPPPLHPPSRSSTILELPTYRYDPSRSKENVRRHSLETPEGGEFCILPESARRSSQVVVYNGSAYNPQNDLENHSHTKKSNKNKSNEVNGNRFDSHSRQPRDHRIRRSKSGKPDGSDRHKKRKQNNELNENISEGKEAMDLSHKDKTLHELPSSSSFSNSSSHPHNHRNRHRQRKSSAPRSSESQSISHIDTNNYKDDDNNSISVSKEDNSKKESEDGIPHRGRGPASVPRTSSSNRMNKQKSSKLKEHHDVPEKLEYEEWLQAQQQKKGTSATPMLESEMSKPKYNQSKPGSTPINSHVYAARRSRERAEHVARHPHLPVSAMTDPCPVPSNEIYDNPQEEEYYIHKAHNGVNDDNEAVSNGHAMQTNKTNPPQPHSYNQQHTDEAFQFTTPQEIDKEENDMMSVSNKENNRNDKIANDGVPELHMNKLNNNTNNNKSRPRSKNKNKDQGTKHHGRKLRSVSSSMSSSSSSSLHFSSSSSSSSFTSTEPQTRSENVELNKNINKNSNITKKEESTPFTSQQVLCRSPSEAAARFRAAHTSGPTSIPLHVLQQRRSSNSNINKSIVNEKDVVDNDYCTPHKENENEKVKVNDASALHPADGTRPVRRGSLDQNEIMISRSTPKHHLPKTSENTGVKDNKTKVKKKINDTQPTLTLPVQSSLVSNRANRRYNGNREDTHSPVSNKDEEINTVNLQKKYLHHNKEADMHEPFYTSPTSILHEVTEGVELHGDYTPSHLNESETTNKNKAKDNTSTIHETQPRQSERFRFRQPTPPESTYQPFISQSRMSLSSRPASRASYESGTISPNNHHHHQHHSGNSVARSFRRSMSEHIPLSARVRARSHSRSESEMRSSHQHDQTENSNNNNNSHHYNNSAACTIGGTELLPSRPLLQGMRSSKDNRALFTINKFIERQPPSTRNELEDMLIEYEGREEELCEVLAEIYGEDFEAQRQMLLMENSMNEPV